MELTLDPPNRCRQQPRKARESCVRQAARRGRDMARTRSVHSQPKQHGSEKEEAETLLDLHKQYKEVKLLQQDDFKTTAGLQCVHLVIELNGTDGRKMRQTYYLFGKGDTEYVFVCTAQADVGDKLDAEIESTMKSFRFKEK